jgi:hypothetical protein
MKAPETINGERLALRRVPKVFGTAACRRYLWAVNALISFVNWSRLIAAGPGA